MRRLLRDPVGVGFWLALTAAGVVVALLAGHALWAVVGWAALGQALTPLQLLGMAIAFGATVLGQLRPRPTGLLTTPTPTASPAVRPRPATSLVGRAAKDPVRH